MASSVTTRARLNKTPTSSSSSIATRSTTPRHRTRVLPRSSSASSATGRSAPCASRSSANTRASRASRRPAATESRNAHTMYVWQTHLGNDASFDPRYHTNPRTEILSFISEPPGTVLDVGCGGGATGQLVKDKFPGTRVVGIEINPSAAEHARRMLDRVVCAGVDDVDPARDMPNERISTVLLLDVLE